MLNGSSLFLKNKSGSILKRKAQDQCLGVQPCARETRGPAPSDGFQSAATKPNLRLEFPPKPCQWAQLELFISWWMEKRARRCWYRLQESANAPISNPSFNSSFQVLTSERWRDVPVRTWAMHNQSKVTADWGGVRGFASAVETWWGPAVRPSWTPLVLTGES